MASRFQGVNNWVLLQKAKHNRAQRFGNLFDAGKQLLTQRTINVKMPPAGHYGDSELEIGRVCVQLASPDFKYLTGETLTLEGGMGLRP